MTAGESSIWPVLVQVLHGAHTKDCEVTSLAFSKDDNTLLSRAADDTLKVRPSSSNPTCACSRLISHLASSARAASVL